MKYIRAQQDIISLIGTKYNEEGLKLPNEIELSREIGVSVITTRRALAELLEHGIIERIQGKGTYVKKVPAKSPPIGEIAYIIIGTMNNFYSSCFVDIQTEAEKRAYRLKLVTGSKNPDSGYTEELKNVKGVIAIGRITKEWYRFLNSMKLPVLTIGGDNFGKKKLHIDFDWENGTKNLVQQLLADGYKNIGLLNGAKGYLPAEKIFKGYSKGIKSYNKKINENLIRWIAKEDYFETIGEYFSKGKTSPHAIIVEEGVFDALLVWFYENPQIKNHPQLGVVNTSPIKLHPKKIYFLNYQLSIARQAAEMMFNVLGNKDFSPKIKYVNMTVEKNC